MPLSKFHCTECRGRLITAPDGGLACEHCATPVPVEDGILDFVQGRAGTILDPGEYDAFHGIDAARSNALYREIQQLAGGQWPASLGSVLEVGCGTGLLSRALISHGDVRDLVLTDVSTAMLRTCRDHLHQSDLLNRVPLTFATHSATEPCFQDVVFDTCAGGSVLHHIPDVRGFLASMFRWLKPGGRAFFMEPNLRHHRALAQTLADILALLYTRDQTYSDSRQKLLNLISQWRRGILHQGDVGFLTTLEDKHMFAGDAFEEMGRELGFATAVAIPTASDPSGTSIVAGLCGQLGIDDSVRTEVLGLLPAYRGRYLSLLPPRDQSSSFLLWLEKGTGPAVRSFRAPPPPAPPPPADTPIEHLQGGLPPHWSLDLTASAGPTGILLVLDGWCLLNTDVKWVRITLGTVTRDAPVWMPRPDVHAALASVGLHASWNSLCCGVRETLSFEGVTAENSELSLKVAIVLASGAALDTAAAPSLHLDETLTVRR